MAREDLHFRLRIPEALKNQIEQAAALKRRSMTAEIIARLEASFAANSLSPSDFLGIMDMQNENAEKLARLLHKIADSVANLGAGGIEMLPDDDEPAAPPSAAKD